MRNLSPWTALASVLFAGAATAAGAAYEPQQPQTSEGQQTPKMQGSDNGTASDSVTPTTPATPGDPNSGASPSPQDIGPRVPQDSLRHQWPNGGSNAQQPGDANGSASTEAPDGNSEDQGTTDSQQAKPDNPASPFSPVNPAAPALQDPKGGDPTNPVTPANMRYIIIASVPEHRT